MKTRRILYFTSAASGYGAENALQDIILKLPGEFEPFVVAPENGPLLDVLAMAGIRTRVVPFAVLHRRYFHPLRFFAYLGSALFSFFRLLALIKELKPAVVHSNNVLILPAAVAARLLHIPHVWHVREIVEHHHINPLLWGIWRSVILTFSARVICISTSVRKQFGDSDKIAVIHDGVDPEFFRPMRKRSSRSKQGRRGVMIGLVGRLEHRRKGQDLFIEAARIALQSRDDLRFVIVGHEREDMEEQEQRLHQMVRQYGLHQKVDFRGLVPRKQMPELMNKLDVLVLCSKQPEGFGLVLLEAMACSKAVIAPAEGGPLDFVEDRRTGLLIPPRDPEELAEAILYLADHPDARKKLGEAGRKEVERSFRADICASKMAALYRGLLSTT